MDDEQYEPDVMDIRKARIERQMELAIALKPDQYYTRDQLHAAAWAMKNDGSFASTIADAYFSADNQNKQRIAVAFADLFLRHLEKRQGA